MIRRRPLALILAIICACSGCNVLKTKTFTPSEAERKLAAFCLKESGMRIITRRVGGTLWIYAPLSIALFDVKAIDPKDNPDRKIMPFSILSLQSEFQEQRFRFNYDILPDVATSDDAQTYGSTYNEAFAQKRQIIYAGIQETFFNASDTPEDKMPSFLAILIVDITKGVGVKSLCFLEDFKKYASQALPAEEYSLRENNNVVGNKKWINNTAGRSIPYEDITWPYFLSEQIKNRIKFKFTQSDFPPKTNPLTEMATLAANTLRIYPFKDYNGIIFYDMRAKKETALTKEQLNMFAQETTWEKTQGRLTTIRFEIPQHSLSNEDASPTPQAASSE